MRKRAKSHLAAVPQTPAKPERPTPVGFPLTVELPTGGRFDVDPLLRELARHAFGPTMVGFRYYRDRSGPRCEVECQALTTFPADEIAAATVRVARALVALGIVKIKATPPPGGPPDATTEEQDGAASPPLPSPPT